MRIRGLVIALSICLPLSLAACNIYFDEGAGSSNHKHHQGPDAAPGIPDADDPFGPDGGWGVPPDAPPDAELQEPDAAIGVPPDAPTDATTCPTSDAAVSPTPDAHTCGC